MPTQWRLLLASLLIVWVGMILACGGGATSRKMVDPDKAKPGDPGVKSSEKTQEERTLEAEIAEADRQYNAKAKLIAEEHQRNVATAEAEVKRLEKPRAVSALAAEAKMKQEGLSKAENRYVTRHAQEGWVRKPWPDASKPSLNTDENMLDGSVGVPYWVYRVGINKSIRTTMYVSKVIISDEMLIQGDKIRVEGVPTAELKRSSTIELTGLFFVDGTETLAPIDPKKIDTALDSEEVKKWMDAEKNYQRARDLAILAAKKERETERAHLAELAQRKSDARRRLAEVAYNRPDAIAARKAELVRKSNEEDYRDEHGQIVLDAKGQRVKVTKNADGKTVTVNGYYRKNGTYVESHTRSAPGTGSGGGRRGGGRR